MTHSRRGRESNGVDPPAGGDLPVASGGLPRELGYRWPAEWEPHAATWLAWPHNEATWPGNFAPVPPQFAQLVRTIARFEPVRILAGGSQVMADARKHVGGVANVDLLDIPTNDAWCRDHGPMFLSGSAESALVDWEYNAWGGKYPPFDQDNAVAGRIARRLARRRFAPGIVLEGGAIDGNGRGAILTTASCLLNENRNSGMPRHSMEGYLADYLSAKKVLWLPRGELAGDDTDGHVDQLARFVNPTTVAAAWQDDADDPNHAALAANFEQLQQMTDQDGRPLDVVRLPLPKAMFYDGQRLPASYCNFYIANGAAIVPQFDDPADAAALEILAELFPDREVVGLPSRELIWGLGSFHCLTQQEPAGDYQPFQNFIW